MELKDLASVSGKGGLFKVLKPSKSGVILETTDGTNKKMVAGLHHKVSILDEISIYTKTSEGSVPLKEVFQTIYKEFGADPDVDISSADELKSFLKHILPDYDESKVYVSDIKKVVNWYTIVHQIAPEILQPEAEIEKKPSKSEKPEGKEIKEPEEGEEAKEDKEGKN